MGVDLIFVVRELSNLEVLLKPVFNLQDLSHLISHEHGNFRSQYEDVSGKVGARRLGYNVTVVPPGKKACPFHNHHINEELFLILEGEGELRFGSDRYPLKVHDVVACPPGGRDVAHQILNTGQTDLKYLAISTRDPYDIVEYPDSNKILSMVGTYEDRKLRHIGTMDHATDYFEGEK